ncbi:uncharacterized protein LOC131619931 [Vicia villosa]|uniref:uncharacterized protein LOC131619931 n=1 Tax=Vicia villosa TaxID=3911 RepID=UPI00273C0C78|nr:uncharacterized protein LOC131619931 [Vicia villosa]
MEFDALFPEINPVPSVPIISPASLAANHQKQPPVKSFAQVLRGVCDIPVSQLPHPIIKGDRPSITIPEDEYKAGLDECKNNLHGRVLWPKGSTPLTVAAMRKKLSSLWPNLKNWGVLSLGKGYYEFTFANTEDMRNVRASGSISLSPGTLKLFAWTRDFNPASQNNTTAQVWVRFFGLSQEYWRPRILFAIASCVGTPICIDAASAKPRMDRTFGHFVRVLIDMDLSSPLNHNVLVEREGFAFFADIEYENLPEFCSHCKKQGHSVHDCKLLRKHDNNSTSKTHDPLPKLVSKPSTVVAHSDENTDPAGEKVDDPNTLVNNIETDVGLVDVTVLDAEVEGRILSPVLEPVNDNPNNNVVVCSSLNYLAHPPDDTNSPESEFVEATQALGAPLNEVFLQNSWDNLAELPDGAFSTAVANLQQKHGTRSKKKHSTRSQAGPKKTSL